ncbi:MAG: YhjD/YihY/BrkB family envelope integrity protein, partial [Gemmatimonadaceae bacterium]
MLSILKTAFRDFTDDECPVRAAALAYYTVFALPPLLVLLIMIAGALWDPQDVQRAMETQFSGLVGQ